MSLGTIGGYLNVSQQMMSLQPSGWDIIVSQLQARLAWAGEAALVAEVDQTGATVPLAAGADAPTVIAALFEAAKIVYENTKGLPTWIAYGPAGWAMLGSLCDAAGRPLFPFLGAANAMGTAGLGELISARWASNESSSRASSNASESMSATRSASRPTSTRSRSSKRLSRLCSVARSRWPRPSASTGPRRQTVGTRTPAENQLAWSEVGP